MRVVSINKDDFTPVSIIHQNNAAEIKSSTVSSQEGIDFVVSPVLTNSHAAVSNDAVTILSQKLKYSDAFIHAERNTSPFTAYTGAIIDGAGNVWKNVSNNLVIENIELSAVETETGMIPYTFDIIQDANGFYQIISAGKYLTLNGNDLSFQEIIANEVQRFRTQFFTISIHSDRFLIFTNETTPRSVASDGSNEIVIDSDITNTNNISQLYFFNLLTTREIFGLKIRNNLISYQENSSLVDGSSPNEDITSSKILVGAINGAAGGKLALSVLETKEHLTPSYTDSNGTARNYVQVFGGNNKQLTHESLHTAYTSDLINISFAPDQITYFHLPLDSQIVPLSASGLIESGAIAADAPWKADKVFLKNADYRLYSPWGNNQSPSQNGQYLCSWLKLDGQDAVWMDRWYKPNEASVVDALETIAPIPSTLIAATSSQTITDVESSLVFNPGGLYAYYRVGNKQIDEIIEDLRIVKNELISSETWEPVEETQQPSTYTIESNGSTSYVFNPGTSLSVAPPERLYNSRGTTWVANISARDWNNLTGIAVLGDYHHETGMGLWVNNIETPLFATHDGTTVFKFNSEGIQINSIKFPTNTVKIVGFGEDHTMFVIDSASGLRYTRYDLNDAPVMSMVVPSTITADTDLENAEMDSEGNLVLVTVPSSRRLKIDRNGNIIENTVQTKSFTINSEDGIIHAPSNTNKCIVSKDGTVWTSDANTVYKNGAVMAVAGIIEGIMIDENEDLWVLHDRQYISKLSSEGGRIFKTLISTDTIGTASINRSILMLSETFNNIKVQRTLVLSTNGTYTQLHWLNYDGALQYTKTLEGAYTSGTNSFYYQKTHVKDKYDETGLLFKFALVDQTSPNLFRPYTYFLSTQNLSPGFHQFVIGYDWKTASAYAYIDNRESLSISIEIPPSPDFPTGFANDVLQQRMVIKGLSNQNIIFGSIGFKQAPLHQYLKSYNKHNFACQISNVRYFAEVLTIADAVNILRSEIQVPVLDWNVSTGRRVYVEEVCKIFLHRRGGYKSSKINIEVNAAGADVVSTTAFVNQLLPSVLPVLANVNKLTVTNN